MKKILITLILLLTFMLTNTSLVFANSPESLDSINAASYILMDSSSGKILYSNNAYKKIYPASTTKMMTAIIVIENTSLTRKVTTTQKSIDAIGNGGMNIGIYPGEVVKIGDLLNALLISSANECAHLLAEKTLNNYNEFIKKMNTRAKELGAKNTHFVNPSGMHNKNHYSTSHDLAIIAKHAMTLPIFKKIVAKESYNIDQTNKHQNWPTLYTKNSFLRYFKKSDYYTKITGIKTGFTSEAKFNLVGSAVNDKGFELISVVNGVETRAERDSYTKLLLESGFKKYDNFKFVKKNQLIKDKLPVVNSDFKTLKLVAKNDLPLILPIDRSKWAIKTFKHINIHNIKAPIKKGANFGYIEYKNHGKSLGKVNIVAYNSVALSKTAKIKHSLISIIFNPITIILIVLIALIFNSINHMDPNKNYLIKKLFNRWEKFKLK